MGIPTQVNFLDERISYNSSRQEEYHGWALIGSPADKPVWLIRKTFYNTDKQKTHHHFTNKVFAFNQVWDDRASLSY